VSNGRIKERSGLNDPAITGRVDLYPFAEQELRMGVSGYYGGTDNANKGGASGAENNSASALVLAIRQALLLVHQHQISEK
jgi:hypothetical protein